QTVTASDVTQPAKGSSTSPSITVNPAAADRLVYTVQPGSATAGSVFGSQPVVKSRDPYGNDSTGGLPANLNVTVALTAGGGTLQGTKVLDIGTAAGNGTVSYTNLRIDEASAGKQLTATTPADVLAAKTSDSFM